MITGINSDNLYVYVLIAGIPTKSDTPNYHLAFGYLISSNQHMVNLEVMVGQLFGRLRRLIGSSNLQFHHVTIDNCQSLRYALAMQLNGMATKHYVRLASRIITKKCTIAEIREFVPIITCLAHYIRSEYDYCAKHTVKKLPRMLHLRSMSFMLSTTSTLVYQFFSLHYINLLSQRFLTESAKKSLSCLAESCGFDVSDRSKPDDFYTELYKNASSPDVVSYTNFC